MGPSHMVVLQDECEVLYTLTSIAHADHPVRTPTEMDQTPASRILQQREINSITHEILKATSFTSQHDINSIVKLSKSPVLEYTEGNSYRF